MPLTKKQREFIKRCGHRWNIKTGATGSGKSFVDYSVVIPKRIQAAKGEGLLVLLGNTRGTLERNILEPMRTLWPGLVGDIRSDNTVEIFGKKVYALGADNKKHVSRIQGATFEYVYGDEITTWSEEVFQMLKSRLRCEHSHFDGTCNPENPTHWFKKFLDSDADIFQQSYIIDDGVLPAHIVSELKKEYAGTVYYDRFILGLWAVAEGLVYPMFNENMVVEEIPWEARQRGKWYISLDYGTVNPTAAGLWCLWKGTAYMAQEYYYDSRAKDENGHGSNSRRTDEEHYAEIEKLAGERDIERIIVDPSAASFKETIRRHKKFSVWDADNSVLDGIRLTATLLQAGRIKIHRSCKGLLSEMAQYRWDEDAGEDKVIKENDHAEDMLRYFCSTIMEREIRGTSIKEELQRKDYEEYMRENGESPLYF